MLKFYHWGDGGLIFISVLSLALFVLQGASLVYGFSRRQESQQIYFLENTFQIVMLAVTFLPFYLIAEISEGYYQGIYYFDNLYYWRYGLFALCFLLAFPLSIQLKNPYPFFAVAATAALSPFAEERVGDQYPLLVTFVLVFLLVRAIHLSVFYLKELNTMLSARSIKEAIDELDAGLLFYENSGRIHLVNTRMQRLMIELTGDIQRNGERFYRQHIVAGNCLEHCAKIELIGYPNQNQHLYQLPNRQIWLFQSTTISHRKQLYQQLSASNITREWQMTMQLQSQEKALENRQMELREAIDNIQTICRREEILRMKSHFHDVLGQRIALLLRNLRENKDTEVPLLVDFLEDLKTALAEAEIRNPEEEIVTLRRLIKKMGVRLYYNGTLPNDPTLARLMSDIIGEAVTNAVRHGFASEIAIHMKEDDDGFHLNIYDNGIPPKDDIIEGGGLTAMRRKIAPYEGTLSVRTTPRFALYIYVPGGERND